MRLTVIALCLLPCGAMAQSTPSLPEAQPGQSCPVGMAWNADLQSCVQAAGGASPLDGLPGHVGCESDTARAATS